MGFFKDLFNKTDKDNESVETKILLEKTNIEEDDDDEVTAVISAVLASMEDEETVAAISGAIAYILGKNTSDFIVRNIKRTPELDSMWAHVGRINLMK